MPRWARPWVTSLWSPTREFANGTCPEPTPPTEAMVAAEMAAITRHLNEKMDKRRARCRRLKQLLCRVIEESRASRALCRNLIRACVSERARFNRALSNPALHQALVEMDGCTERVSPLELQSMHARAVAGGNEMNFELEIEVRMDTSTLMHEARDHIARAQDWVDQVQNPKQTRMVPT